MATKSVAVPTSSPLAMLSKQPMQALENFQGSSPWLQFHHNMAKNNAAVVGKLGPTPNGTPVYCGPGNEFVKCDPFVFLATPVYEQGYGLFDNSGNIVDYKQPDGTQPPKHPWAEVVSSFIILDVPGKGLTPCRAEFRRAYGKGFKAAIESIAAVDAPQWKDTTRENKQIHALAVKHGIPPWAMVVHTGTTRIVPKPPPANSYGISDTVTTTATPAIIEALAKAMKNEQFNAQCQACMEDQRKRVASFRASVKS